MSRSGVFALGEDLHLRNGKAEFLTARFTSSGDFKVGSLRMFVLAQTLLRFKFRDSSILFFSSAKVLSREMLLPKATGLVFLTVESLLVGMTLTGLTERIRTVLLQTTLDESGEVSLVVVVEKSFTVDPTDLDLVGSRFRKVIVPNLLGTFSCS